MSDEFCPRCGFTHGEIMNLDLDGWPEHLPKPTEAPQMLQPHPVGVCCSPFKIGDKLFWDLDSADLDMPPLRVVFKELVEIESAHFKLMDNKWIKETEPRASVAKIMVDKNAVYPCHESHLGELLDRDLEVKISSLTPVEKWPVLEIA